MSWGPGRGHRARSAKFLRETIVACTPRHAKNWNDTASVRKESTDDSKLYRTCQKVQFGRRQPLGNEEAVQEKTIPRVNGFFSDYREYLQRESEFDRYLRGCCSQFRLREGFGLNPPYVMATQYVLASTSLPRRYHSIRLVIQGVELWCYYCIDYHNIRHLSMV